MQTELCDPETIAAALKSFMPRQGSPVMRPLAAALAAPRAGEARRAGGLSGDQDVCAAMSAHRYKTDATNALAHVVRIGWFHQSHIKTESCYRLRLLLTQSRNLKRKVLDHENTIRQSLKPSASASRASGVLAVTRRGARR